MKRAEVYVKRQPMTVVVLSEGIDPDRIDLGRAYMGELVIDLTRQLREAAELQRAAELEAYAAASNEIHGAFDRLGRYLAYIAGAAGYSGQILRQKLDGTHQRLQALKAELIRLATQYGADQESIIEFTQVIDAHTVAVIAVLNGDPDSELKLLQTVQAHSAGLDDKIDSLRDQLLSARRPKGMALDLILIAQMGEQLRAEYSDKDDHAIVGMIISKLRRATPKSNTEKAALKRLTEKWTFSTRGDNLRKAIERLNHAE